MRCWMVLLLPVLPAAALAVEREPVPTCVQKQGKASLWLMRGSGEPLAVKLSETLTIIMRVEGEAPLEVELTQKIHSAPGWYLEAIGMATTTVIEDGKARRWEQTLLATPLQPGLHPLPLPALQFSEKDGREHEVAWDPLQLTITTRIAKVEGSEAREPTGIEELPPLPVAMPWWPWLLVVSAGLLTMSALLLLRRRRRRRPVIQPLPSLAALKELKELDALSPASAEEANTFYTRLSDVLRQYLEKRFALPATRWTTAESSSALASVWPQDGQQKGQLDAVLRTCDIAKYAGAVPASEECQRLVSMAREFVEATAVMPAPPTAGESPVTGIP